MYMSRPQNFDSSSLRMRSCLMYFVVAGSGIGGMVLSRTIFTASVPFGSQAILRGVL